jgi:hypothetical protein
MHLPRDESSRGSIVHRIKPLFMFRDKSYKGHIIHGTYRPRNECIFQGMNHPREALYERSKKSGTH